MKIFQLKYPKDNNLQFYQQKQEYYNRILESKNINVNSIHVNFHAYGYPKNLLMNTIETLQTKFQENTNDVIYMFNELDVGNLKILFENEIFKKNIKDFLKKNKYVIFFCEIFENEKLQTIGNLNQNEEFPKLFFENAFKIFLCDSKNIEYLKNINQNVVYFPPIGYSTINNITKRDRNTCEYDLFFYGNINENFIPYRSEMLSKLKKESDNQKWNFIYGTYFGKEKKDIMDKTKIIVHIPSYKNLRTMPWAKISELMSFDYFFILEKNEEMFQLGLQDLFCYYENFEDLIQKIKYYLIHENERLEISKKLHEYIKENFNMDKLLHENICNDK